MRQDKRVLMHLQNYGSITSLEALNRYGIIQLPRRVYDLRRRGWLIETKYKMVTNRYGERVRIGVFALTDPVPKV